MTQYAPIEWRLAVSPACRVAPPGTVLTVWKWPATAEYCVGNIDPAVAARLQEGLQAAKASSTCNARLSHRAHCPDRIWYQGESRRIPARSIVSRTSVNLTCTLDKRSLYRGGNRFRSLQCRKPQYSPLPAEEVHPRRANLLHPIPRAMRRASAHRSRSVRRRPIKELEVEFLLVAVGRRERAGWLIRRRNTDPRHGAQNSCGNNIRRRFRSRSQGARVSPGRPDCGRA